MADKVKLSKDGNSIDFVQSESIPTSVKKFRQSPEIEGFYRFIYENDLQKEAYEILERIVNARKVKKKTEKLEAAPKKADLKVEAKKAAQPVTVLKKALAKPAAPAKKAVPEKREKPKVAAKPAKAVTKAVVKVAAKKSAAPAKKKAKKK